MLRLRRAIGKLGSGWVWWLAGLFLMLWTDLGNVDASGNYRAAATGVHPPAHGSQGCRRVELRGEVLQGTEWKATIGEGWIFRVVPILSKAGRGPSGVAEFNSKEARRSSPGWDLVMDRVGEGAGYPDGLLLATPPYGSLNEREIGTTYGLRAQDAIGWEPRRFRFMTSTADLKHGREVFRSLMMKAWMTKAGMPKSGGGGNGGNDSGRAEGQALIDLSSVASRGEFVVNEARLIAGLGDPKPFAQRWGVNLKNVPHSFDTSEVEATPEGEIRWLRFTATLWLPHGWKFADGTHSEEVKCAE